MIDRSIWSENILIHILITIYEKIFFWQIEIDMAINFYKESLMICEEVKFYNFFIL